MVSEQKWQKEPWDEDFILPACEQCNGPDKFAEVAAANLKRARECVNFLSRFPNVDLSTARVAEMCANCDGAGEWKNSIGDWYECNACQHTGYRVLEPTT